MRPFHLESDMKTLRGTFYPTGWMVLMFPGKKEACDAARLLEDHGLPEEDAMLISPECVREELVGAIGDDEILPSAGSEGDTVRRYAELAATGHYGLMVHAPKQADCERVMGLLKDAPIAYGQKYRFLVIEDLVT